MSRFHSIFFIHFFKFNLIININSSLLPFCLLFCIFVLLDAVLCEKRLCKRDELLHNFQNLKIIFSSFVFFFKLGKNRIGGSVKQKRKFLLPNIVHLMASGITTSYCTDRGLVNFCLYRVELKRKKGIVSAPLHNT